MDVNIIIFLTLVFLSNKMVEAMNRGNNIFKLIFSEMFESRIHLECLNL